MPGPAGLLSGKQLMGAEDEDRISLATKVAAARPPKDWRGRIDYTFGLMLQRTGLTLSVGQAVAVLAVIGLFPALLVALFRGLEWRVGIALVLGPGLALAILFMIQGRWRRRVQDQLPDAFFLLARSLRAGRSLEESLSTVGEHGLKPASDEFRRCIGHVRLGLTVTAALQLMAGRLNLSDFNGLVALVTLHRTTGGNLPALLDRWAGSTRDRNQFRGYFRSATTLARISTTALASAVPFFLVGYWIIQPDYLIRFAQTASGAMALGIIAALEVSRDGVGTSG